MDLIEQPHAPQQNHDQLQRSQMEVIQRLQVNVVELGLSGQFINRIGKSAARMDPFDQWEHAK